MENSTAAIFEFMATAAKPYIIEVASHNEAQRITSISSVEDARDALDKALNSRRKIRKLADRSASALADTMWVGITELLVQQQKCALWDFGEFHFFDRHPLSILFEPGFVFNSGNPLPDGSQGVNDLALYAWHWGPLGPNAGFPFRLAWKDYNHAEWRYTKEEDAFKLLRKKLRKALKISFGLLKNPYRTETLKAFYETRVAAKKDFTILDLYAHYVSVCAYWSYLSMLRDVLKPKSGITIKSVGTLSRYECCKYELSADRDLLKLISAGKSGIKMPAK